MYVPLEQRQEQPKLLEECTQQLYTYYKKIEKFSA